MPSGVATTTKRFQRGLAKTLEYQPQDVPHISSHTKRVKFYQDLADPPNLGFE